MVKRKGVSESKSDYNSPRDLVFYINDIHLISIILNFLTQSEIKWYSQTSKSNRELTLKLGLIKYMLKPNQSKAFYKNGLGEINELGGSIVYQVLKGVKITLFI